MSYYATIMDIMRPVKTSVVKLDNKYENGTTLLKKKNELL